MTSIISPLVIEDNMTTASASHIQPMASKESNPKYLGNLGKPTLRGVRKCGSCGTLNGTRGLRCKNKSCDQVFKTADKKKPFGPEAVKVITDPMIQIYSVRTKTGDSRGFVQLPIVQDLEGNPAVVDVGIVCSAAKCYIETCGRARNDTLDPCFHIRSSVEAIEEAVALDISPSVLDSLPITPEIKQKILALDAERQGPLVQRISKNVMVVKTSVTQKHPLGYLHFIFLSNKKEEKRFICSCREAKTVKVLMSENGSECTYRIQRCVHFYACLCAFASNEDLAKEFKFVLDAENEEKSLGTINKVAVEQNEIEAEAEAAVVSMSDSLLSTSTVTDDSPMEIIISSSAADQPGIDYTCPISPAVNMPEVKRFKSNSVMYHTAPQNLNPNQTYQSFMQWLNSVTERINLTMHYQLPGNPAPLVFLIPQVFWECLQQRISLSSMTKRRLPDHSTTIHRTHAPPIGSFSKFSWYLTELSHVRKVFDTAEVALLVSKYFDKCKDGSFKLSSTPRVQVESVSDNFEPRIPNKGHEYKTFLRVGPHGNQGIVPFVIDWLPDLFPITRTGELTLHFQYSHLIDGLAPAVHDDMVKQVIDNSSRHHTFISE